MTEENGAPPPPDLRVAGHVASIQDRRLLFLVFFFAVYFYLLYQLARVLSPFMAPLFGAVVAVLIFYPLHTWLLGRLKRPTVAAAASTAIVLVTIVVPVIVLAWLLVRETAAVVPAVQDWLAQRGDLASALESLPLPAPLEKTWHAVLGYIQHWNVDLRSVAVEALRDLGNSVTHVGAATVRGFFGVLLDLIVLVLTMFFFFRDGTAIVRWILDLVPMEEANKMLIVGRLDRTLSAIVRGAFITASVQGALTGVGLAVAGVPFPVVLGFVAALLSVVPFLGASLVWAPAAIYLLIGSHTLAAVGLLIWGALVVGLVDNFLRPYLVGERAQLPILLILLGVLGGIQVYGLVGALVSPLLIATVLAFAQIYREQYLMGNQQR